MLERQTQSDDVEEAVALEEAVASAGVCFSLRVEVDQRKVNSRRWVLIAGSLPLAMCFAKGQPRRGSSGAPCIGRDAT